MTLYTLEKGQQNPTSLVFLHGLGVSSWMWTDQLALLEKEYHCIAIDLPGNGESYQTEWLSLEDTARQVADVILAKAHNQRAHVIGLSLGGYVTVELVNSFPNMVNTAIVSGITTKPIPNAKLLKWTVMAMYPMQQWTWMIDLTAKTMQMPKEVYPLFRRDTKRLSRNTTGRVYEAILNYQLPPDLARRENRLLGVAGDQEQASVIQNMVAFPKIMPHAQAVTAPNSHHIWVAEHPQLFADMIRAWVENKPLPTDLKPMTV